MYTYVRERFEPWSKSEIVCCTGTRLPVQALEDAPSLLLQLALDVLCSAKCLKKRSRYKPVEEERATGYANVDLMQSGCRRMTMLERFCFVFVPTVVSRMVRIRL